MLAPFEYIAFGPFNAAYYQQLVDDAFKERFAAYLRLELLPQVTITPERIAGKLTALNDEDRFCGPHSCIRDSFHLVVEFQQGDLNESLDVCIHYSPNKYTFHTSNRKPIRLLTLERQRQLAELNVRWEKDKSTIQAIWARMQSGEIKDGDEENCPVCGTTLVVSNRPDSMMLRCSECFTLQYHRDPETGEFRHGHSQMSPKYFKSF